MPAAPDIRTPPSARWWRCASSGTPYSPLRKKSATSSCGAGEDPAGAPPSSLRSICLRGGVALTHCVSSRGELGRRTSRPGASWADEHLAPGSQPRIEVRPLAGYTFGMKTAVSLPDEVFDEAERLARRLKK